MFLQLGGRKNRDKSTRSHDIGNDKQNMNEKASLRECPKVINFYPYVRKAGKPRLKSSLLIGLPSGRLLRP